MNEQLTIFDYMPSCMPEPGVGEIIHKHGAVICHIMRPGYVGQKVCFDVSTQSMRNMYRVGILEKIFTDHYFQLVGNKYQKRECDRVVIYTGKKQRSYISLMPGREIYECLPWNAYPARMNAIGKKGAKHG